MESAKDPAALASEKKARRSMVQAPVVCGFTHHWYYAREQVFLCRDTIYLEEF